MEVAKEVKLNFFNRLNISVFKIKKYPILIKEGLNKALIFVLTLSLIIGLFLGGTQIALVSVVEKASNEVLSNPNFEFVMDKGILDFKNSPYIEESGSVISIVDSNKLLSEAESYRSKVVHKDMSIVFFKDGVIARNNGTQYELKYSQIPLIPERVDNSLLLSLIDKIGSFKYVMVLATILSVYLTILLTGFVVSLAGLVANKIYGINIRYKDLLKISLYSMTLPTILKLIVPIGSFSIVIAGIYLVLAINSIKPEIN